VGVTVIDPNELEERRWPRPVDSEEALAPSERRGEALRRKYHWARVYVSEGHLIVRALGRTGFGKPIPPGESAIGALLATPYGGAFGATSGRRLHLFAYDKGPDGDTVIDLGTVGNETACERSLAFDAQGNLWGASTSESPSYEGALFFRYPNEPPKATRQGYFRAELEIAGVLIRGEGVAGLVGDRKRNIIYGLTSKSGTLFAFDPISKKVHFIDKVDPRGQFSKALVAGKNGRLFGAGREGRLFLFDPETQKLQHLDITAPALAGREMYNAVDSFALDPASGFIYGGTKADGILFRLDPQRLELTCLGKPAVEPRIRALTVANDGRVYGVAGAPGGIGRLFVYEPSKGALRDLGVMLAARERFWHGHEFASACTDRDGMLYFGEADRISHLFIYYPAVRAQG